jgi:hypothetical protein
MIVTKRKSGYRIDLSEAEMAALRTLISHGKADMVDESQLNALPKHIQRILGQDRWLEIGGPLYEDAQ